MKLRPGLAEKKGEGDFPWGDFLSCHPNFYSSRTDGYVYPPYWRSRRRNLGKRKRTPRRHKRSRSKGQGFPLEWGKGKGGSSGKFIMEEGALYQHLRLLID